MAAASVRCGAFPLGFMSTAISLSRFHAAGAARVAPAPLAAAAVTAANAATSSTKLRSLSRTALNEARAASSAASAAAERGTAAVDELATFIEKPYERAGASSADENIRGPARASPLEPSPSASSAPAACSIHDSRAPPAAPRTIVDRCIATASKLTRSTRRVGSSASFGPVVSSSLSLSSRPNARSGAGPAAGAGRGATTLSSAVAAACPLRMPLPSAVKSTPPSPHRRGQSATRAHPASVQSKLSDENRAVKAVRAKAFSIFATETHCPASTAPRTVATLERKCGIWRSNSEITYDADSIRASHADAGACKALRAGGGSCG